MTIATRHTSRYLIGRASKLETRLHPRPITSLTRRYIKITILRLLARYLPCASQTATRKTDLTMSKLRVAVVQFAPKVNQQNILVAHAG